MSQGERLMARVHAHPRSMGPKLDSLLYAILSSLLLRNRFVLPLWIRQTDTYFPHSDPPLDPPLIRAPRFRQWIPASND